MRERRQLLKDVLISEHGNERRVVRCEVAYSKGGWNNWSYKQEPRGYWLHVQPMGLEQGDGYTMQKFMMFSGKKYFLLQAKRYSDKGLRDAVPLGEQMLLTPVVAEFIEECVRVPVEA